LGKSGDDTHDDLSMPRASLGACPLIRLLSIYFPLSVGWGGVGSASDLSPPLIDPSPIACPITLSTAPSLLLYHSPTAYPPFAAFIGGRSLRQYSVSFCRTTFEFIFFSDVASPSPPCCNVSCRVVSCPVCSPWTLSFPCVLGLCCYSFLFPSFILDLKRYYHYHRHHHHHHYDYDLMLFSFFISSVVVAVAVIQH